MSSARSDGGRRRWLRSLSVRLTGWYLLVFVVSTVLLSAALGLEIRSSVRQSSFEAVTGALAVHKQALETGGTIGLQQLAASADQSFLVRVIDSKETTTFEARSASSVQLETSKLSPAHLTPPVQALQDGAGATWNLATTPLAGGRFLQLALRDQGSEQVLGRLRTGLAAVWLAAIAIGLVGGFLLTSLSLRPVRELTATARQVIRSGDLALRVPEAPGDDDLHELARLFNGVLERNQKLMLGMREALDNVAHDLRTPLTRLRTGAEVALREPAEPGQVREALAETIEESDEVLGLLTSLMDITEAETGVMRLELLDLDLSAVVATCVELYAHVAEERGVRVVTRLLPELWVKGDRRRLQQAVANLLDNALKYTPVGGLVELVSSREGKWAVVTIQDNGPGIPAEDLPRIWTRLFRGDSSRSQPGLGLGLSFVKAIVEAHHGEVGATSTGSGATLTLRLPERPSALTPLAVPAPRSP